MVYFPKKFFPLVGIESWCFFVIGIDPVAVRLGTLEIRWYGILMAIAVALGTVLAYQEAKKRGIHPDHIVNLIIIGTPLSLIGARIYYVIFSWEYYIRHLGEIIKIWHGGLAFHGGIIVALITGLLYARWQRLKFWVLADIVAPSLILGQAIGRWGNFFNQEAYGYPTNLPWAMYIDGAYRHPTFLYESLWNLLIFLFLVWFRRRPGNIDGDVFLFYLAFYSLGRFFIESLRVDSLMLGSLRAAQVFSVGAILITVWLYYFHHRKQQKK